MPATTIYREIAIEVEYTVSRYYPATLEQPAEGGEIEVVSATYNGEAIELTDDEIAGLSDDADDFYDDADRRYEEARDARIERELSA